MPEMMTSKEAADKLGVSVQTWHRLVARHHLTPVMELPGLRGAKFWASSDVMIMLKVTTLDVAS